MLTHEMIEKIVLKEREEKKLSMLPEDFFESVRAYLEKKSRISETKEDRWELDWAKRSIQDLLDIREGKILSLALAYVKAGVTPGNITPEEKEFFDGVVERIKEFHARKAEVLEGKKDRLAAVALLQDVPRFVGVNMHNYGPFKKGDVANLPEENAKLLLEKGIAKKISI